MIDDSRIAGSFRDVAGHVYDIDGRIYRTVNQCAAEDFSSICDANVIAESIEAGFLIPSRFLAPDQRPVGFDDVPLLIEHDRLPFVSYPYEWSFSQLKAAALHHLDFQIFLFERGVTLCDASAYNVQFIHAKPVFIDVLSLRPYREGEFWLGHRQFCEQFLNPLLLRTLVGIAHNAWFKGALEGIPTENLARVIPLPKKLSFNVFSQVVLQARIDRAAAKDPDSGIIKAAQSKKLSKNGYLGLLMQMRNWVAKLQPRDTAETTWGNYQQTQTYSEAEIQGKTDYIQAFINRVQPDRLIDLGCNIGHYSAAALDAGAGHVVGFDFDQQAIDIAYSRANEDGLKFLPLLMDAANPSPDHGWLQSERLGFSRRVKGTAIIALAFIHHLAIAKNIPLSEVIDWIVDIAPNGIIEFVPKSDPTVQTMLALREDIFEDYDEEHFKRYLVSRADIIDIYNSSSTGRVLYCYKVNK